MKSSCYLHCFFYLIFVKLFQFRTTAECEKFRKYLRTTNHTNYTNILLFMYFNSCDYILKFLDGIGKNIFFYGCTHNV